MPLKLKDALRLATKDPEFAQQLVTDPAALKVQFHLNDAQVGHLKELGSAAAKAQAGLGGVHGPGPVSAYE